MHNTPPILRKPLSLSPFLHLFVSSFRGSRPQQQIDMRDRAEENDVRHHVTCARETGSRSGRLFVARVGPLLHRSPKEHCRTQLVVIATVCVCVYVYVLCTLSGEEMGRRERSEGDGERGEEAEGISLWERAGLSDSFGAWTRQFSQTPSIQLTS